MPEWAGKWKGGRYYLDDRGRKVFFIERRIAGKQKGIKLQTHDEDLANGELARFEVDPIAYTRPAEVARFVDPVYITTDRINVYLQTIRKTVEDHRNARRAQLFGWSKLGLDLRLVDRKALRTALASFDGGHKGRAEALNAFARFLVKEGDLAAWRPLECHLDPGSTRAAREAYSLDQLRETYARLVDQPVKDVFHLRAATGMHQTEIEQLINAPVIKGPLPDKGIAIRELGGDHEIQGVIQIVHRKKHKKERRHRVSVDAAALRAALRLRAGVPYREWVWEAVKPLVPSNLRHTFVTLSGEVGRLVSYKAEGVDRSRIAQVVGHRPGSTMTADRYDKQQIPPMIVLPLDFQVL